MMVLDIEANPLEQLMQQGHECLKQKKQHQALLYFNKVLLLGHKNINALVLCAEILMNLNRPAEALIYSERALQLKPNCEALALHAKVLYQMGKYIEALEGFECILSIDPSNYVAMTQRALCLTQLNRHEEALQIYQQALAYNQQDSWIHYNYSLCLLATGNLYIGFTYFESRWLFPPLLEKRHTWVLPENINSEILKGKSFLIHSEQGLGDSIQFFRYVPLLLQFGVQIFLEMQPSLIPLFSAWRYTIHFIAAGAPLPICDYHCPMMSLAALFKTEISTIPHSIPYIFPDLSLFDHCREKLGHTNNQRIGIAWRGSNMNSMNQTRSIALPALLTLQAPHLEFICLQKDVYLEEKKELDQYRILYHGLELSTMTGTASLIACLDLIITVDTSIAHLAAAMGKKVWILLPFNADWRWFLQRDDSPWYPQVKLFRQEMLGNWDIPLARIRNALIALKSVKESMGIDALMQEAHLQLQNGLFFEAEALYQNVLVVDPSCHTALHKIAIIALQQNNMADAVQFMQQAVQIAPTIALYRRNLGELLCRIGQFKASINVHHSALSIEPCSAENHFLLALAYNNNHQFELAIQHYRIALSYDQNDGLAWNNLGASLENVGDKQQAKEAYAAAIRLNSKHAEALNNLGAIYSEEGRIDEARLHFEAAILAKSDFVEAHYNLSLVKTYIPQDPHLFFLENITKTLAYCPVQTRIQYYFAYAKALDDTQQYARAFKAYAEGNRLHYQQKPWNKTKLHEIVEQLPQIFTPSFLIRSAKQKETRCPIFIVGMPRAGTTLIEQILSSHKNIFGAGELSILDDVIQEACHATHLPFHIWAAQLTDQEFSILGKRYLEKTWELAPDKDFIIDKMPSNCFYIGMIYRMLPTAKIIHAMRDPMDSCFSCFTHLFKNGMLFTYDLTALGNYYQLYAKAMQHWHDVLPSDFLFDLPYEEMVNHHEELSKQLIEFIGLPWDPNCLNFHKNERLVKTASLIQVRKPIYKTSVRRWAHFSEELQPLLKLVSSYRNKKVNA